jgi:hypothetical protein|tara:strand:+ start:7027 stop:7221 length:195 start_codon:yes stop_codon:yes gene_type:complete
MEDYKIVTSRNADGLWAKVKDLMDKGWKPVGGHHVVEWHRQNVYAGTQHKHTNIKLEYSQTLIK